MRGLAEKNILVTGGASGIGRATSLIGKSRAVFIEKCIITNMEEPINIGA